MARRFGKFAALIFCVLTLASYAQAQSTQRRFVPGELLVKVRNSSKSDDEYKFLGKAQMQKGLSLKAQWRGMGLFHFKAADGKDIQAVINDLNADPDVEYAEPNYLFEKASLNDQSTMTYMSPEETADVSAQSASYLATGAPIGAPETWSIMSATTDRPIVAIIDTGLEVTHSVFASTGAVWVNTGEIAGNGVDDDHNGYVDDRNGWNFVANNGNMIDDDGHGTHVAGIVLGTTQDIYNPPLAAAQIRIMPLKFLDGNGVGKTSDAIEAVYYAVSNGAKIMNNSWGGPSYSAALHQAIAYAYSQGVLFVAAAGNNATNNDSAPMYPASYDVPNVLSVAATTNSDGLAYFSNFGRSTVDLGSPGYDILSTYKGNMFVSMRGTSMATPFVAGLAALIKREKPTMLGYQIKNVILDGGDLTASLANKTVTENRLNVYASVLSSKSAVVDTSQPAYTYTNQDRGLASTLATSGCGTVGKLYDNMRGGGDGEGGSGSPGTWFVILIIGLLAAPLAVMRALRKTQPESRRAHPRYKIDTEVKMNLDGKEFVASISSIGLGGVQLNTDALLERGGVVKMSIQSPDGQEMVEVEGRVVWSEANKSYGVQFEKAKESVLQRIGNWTAGLVKT